MKLLCIRAVSVVALLLSVLPARAQAQSYKTWSEGDLYVRGKDRLLKGRDLESAITMLSALVERKPGDADYQMMLGCACVSRLASLHCAAEDAKIVESARRAYQKRVKIWQAMQADNTLPLFGKPEPVAPVDPITPDDGKAFDPLDAAAQKRVSDLSLLALHSFHEAIRLDKALTPKHKTQVDYTCGWGMLLLYRSARESIKFQEVAPPVKPDSASLTLPVTPDDMLLTQKEILACFQACADAGSSNADYWQSLAFANAPDYLTDDITLLSGEKIANAKTDRIAEAVQNMQRALALKRADPDLLYQTALLSSLTLPDKALDSLKKLTLLQNTNAVNFYFLAATYFKQAERLSGIKASQARQDALSAIEAGNQAPEYYNVAMILPLPKPLLSAWTYRRMYGLGLDANCLDSLFGFLTDAGSNTLQKEGEDFMRAGVALMEMGKNALRHYDGPDLDPGDLRTHVLLYNRAFFGMVCCAKADKLIQTAAAASPNATNVSVAADYAQSKAYWQAWDRALIP